MKLTKIVKQTDNKFLNMYVAEYSGKTTLSYFFASRRSEDNLQKQTYVDCVKVLPYIPKTNEIVFIKNFRYVINDYVYEMPAGMVDKGEDTLTAAKREVREEIGAEITSIKKVTNVGFTSVGLTDETMETYFAEVELGLNQDLDADEVIEVVRVNVNDCENFLNSHTVDCITALMVKLFLAEIKK